MNADDNSSVAAAAEVIESYKSNYNSIFKYFHLEVIV